MFVKLEADVSTNEWFHYLSVTQLALPSDQYNGYKSWANDFKIYLDNKLAMVMLHRVVMQHRVVMLH